MKQVDFNNMKNSRSALKCITYYPDEIEGEHIKRTYFSER